MRDAAHKIGSRLHEAAKHEAANLNAAGFKLVLFIVLTTRDEIRFPNTFDGCRKAHIHMMARSTNFRCEVAAFEFIETCRSA